MSKTFHICTLVNNLVQYNNMKSSFIDAGFIEEKCRYTLFDNSQSNIYEPYSTFKKIKENTSEPYIIFCHQDVLTNQGHGFEQLIKVLQELDDIDSSWAVVGNAGFDNNYRGYAKITDPVNKPGNCILPHKVHSLDENFLVIKSTANIESSADLSGFHFYGTDLCLNAIQKGYSCYVIDFHLTHLSLGNKNEVFWEMKQKFHRRWNREFHACYIKSPTEVIMGLSRYKIIEFLMNQQNIQKLLMYKRKSRNFFNPYVQSRLLFK